MIGKRVIPCLLLKDRGLYKTVRFSNPKYVGDPINAVRVFNDKEVDEITVLDIGAARTGIIDFDLIQDFASECFMPLCYGGGIRQIAQMQRLFDLGLEKLSLNTAAFETPDLVTEAAKQFGSQSVVVSIDVRAAGLRKSSVVIRSGSQRVRGTPVEHARRAADRGAGEVLLTSIDREGTGRGYDTRLIAEVASSVEIPLVAHGGAGRVEHLKDAFDAGASGAAAGSLFVFQGPHKAVLISYPTQEEQEIKLAPSQSRR